MMNMHIPTQIRGQEPVLWRHQMLASKIAQSRALHCPKFHLNNFGENFSMVHYYVHLQYTFVQKIYQELFLCLLMTVTRETL